MPGRRNPFEEIEELFEQLNDGFAEMSENMGDQPGGGAVKVDVADRDDAVVVTADVPGFEAEDIDVSVQDRRLTIAAEHSESSEADEGEQYYRRERTRRAVRRTVALPTEVEEADASASYENGVLTVELPKLEEAGAGVDIAVE